MNRMRLAGVFAPIPTPFDQHDQVDTSRLRAALSRWVTRPLTGFIVLGSNGEAALMDDFEADRVIVAAREVVPSDRPFIVGTGRESTQAAVRACRRAAEHGADAALVRTPAFFKSQMTTDAFVRHYTAVADASPVPVIVYSVPVFTGVALESRLVIELAKHPNIRGMKDSSGDVRLISETVWNTDQAMFSVVAGTGATLLHTMSAGARGGIVALVCAAPKAMIELYRAYVSGDLKKADAVQRIIAPAANAVTSEHGISGLKYAMELEGFQPGIARRPLLPIKTVQQEDLQQIFRRMNSELSELS